MLRRLIAILAVVAAVVCVLAWERERESSAVKRRLDCPDEIGSRLPRRGAPRSTEAPATSINQIADLAIPIGMASRAGDDGLYVIQQTGLLRRVINGVATTVLDLTNEVSTGTEQGLLGVAFSPDGERMYTNHTDLAGDTHVTEWSVVNGSASNRRVVLVVDQPHRWHNGGGLAFGPDGMLYVALGDGGGHFDPFENGQSLGTLLGKILRIDPRQDGNRPYSVPPGNPFLGRDGARPEIWAYGLRNPWRLSFDAETGDLWIGDVGEGCFEELNFEQAGFRGGANYGWDRFEGAWLSDGPAPPGFVAPVYTYRRDGAMTCAIVGGNVYRGSAIPALHGWYVFGDLCHGQLMAWRGPGQGEPVALGHEVKALSSFGVDHLGELYALSLGGEVFKIVPAA